MSQKSGKQSESLRHMEQELVALLESKIEAPFYLLDVEIVKESGEWIVRVTLERLRGEASNADSATADLTEVTLEDCALLSPVIDEMIEAYTPIQQWKGGYMLEVSSPGLFRKLRTPREFQFYVGHAVELKAKSGKGQFLPCKQGIVKGYDAEHQTLQILPLQPASESTAGVVGVDLTQGPGVDVTLSALISWQDIEQMSDSELATFNG